MKKEAEPAVWNIGKSAHPFLVNQRQLWPWAKAQPCGEKHRVSGRRISSWADRSGCHSGPSVALKERVTSSAVRNPHATFEPRCSWRCVHVNELNIPPTVAVIKRD